MQRLPGIHGLRAIAALGVVLFHMVAVTRFITPPPPFDSLIPHLLLCIALFFVLSAFSLAYAHHDSVGRESWILPYLIKRFFRIAPLFYAMLPVWYWAGWPRQTPELLLTNITFVFNFIPGQHESLVWAGWSIGVEMPFYLAFPLILARVKKPAQGLVLLIAASGVSILARLWIASRADMPANYDYMSFASNLVFFAAGLLAYQCFVLWRKHQEVWRWVALVVVGCLVLLPFRHRLYYPGQPDMAVWGLVFGALCAWQAASPSRWLASAPMQWLGERSFSLYLLHPFVIFMLMTHAVYAWIWQWLNPIIGTWAFLPCLGVTYAVLVPAAGTTYLLIERPGQKAGGMVIKYWRASRSVYPNRSRPAPRAR